MFLNDNQIKQFDFSNYAGCDGFFSKSNKLFTKRDDKSHYKITVGYGGYPFDMEEFVFKKIGIDDNISIQKNIRNYFNIYYEKHVYIKNIDFIFPDAEKISAIFNFHFQTLLHYKVIKPNHIKKCTNKEDIIEYCQHNNYPVISSFEWEKNKGKEYTINNESHICLVPTVNNKFMMALSIRLPVKKNVVIKLYAIPQQDGSYIYAIRNFQSRSKNEMFLIDDMTTIFNYIENSIFENTHYTKKIRSSLGVFNREDYTEENLKVYEMSKY
jgi:hypothetical protein